MWEFLDKIQNLSKGEPILTRRTPSYSQDAPPEFPVWTYVHKMQPLLFFSAYVLYS